MALVHTCLSNLKEKRREKPKASFTLEAAVLLPAITCFMVAVLFFFRVIEVQQNLYEAMEYTGRTMSVFSFAENYGEGVETLEKATPLAASSMTHLHYKKNFTDPDQAYRYTDALGGAGFSMLASDTDGDFIHLKADYSVRLPIDFFGKQVILGHQEVKCRKWNGYQADGIEEKDEEDEWVYVTPRGSVYHRDRSCHYLDLTIRSVSKASVDGLRNKEGACYYPCDVCGRRKAAGLIYITDYGTSYHTSLSCSGLKRSIDMVRLSEAGRPPCSKCG